MGNITSHNIIEPVNYDCPTCRKSNKLPNIAGKFNLIDKLYCKCNGCNIIYDKSIIYKNFNQ